MILDRPLESVPTKALYALHRGIEKRKRLITGVLAEWFNDHVEVCALGVLLTPQEQMSYSNIEYVEEVNNSHDEIWKKLVGKVLCQGDVATLNNGFHGTPEQRREFMLRHIVNELRERGKSIDGKAAEKELVRIE